MNLNVNVMEQNVIQINDGITINDDVSLKNHIYAKNYVWNPAACNCVNGKYLASIIDDSTIICDEVIKSYNEEINSEKKKAICKTHNFLYFTCFLINYYSIIDSS